MKRYIKNENINNEIINIEPKTSLMHPITLELLPNNSLEPMCLTKLYLDDNKLQKYNKYKCITNNDNYKKYLYIPPIGYNSDDLLQIYDIKTIDNLNNFISNNIDILNILTINRIINCWIRINFDILIKHNNILEEIYIKLIENNYINIIKDFNLKNETIKFINEWLKKHNKNDFTLNLLNDYIIYIKNNI